MDSSDSLQLDEHLARLLAAYDQGIEGGDAKAPTIGVPESPHPLPGERRVNPLSGSAANEGSLGEVLPDPPKTPRPAVATPGPPGPPRIGRFELRRQLGKGGCGIVFLAFDPKLEREVALKIPRPEMLLSQDARRRLVREALAAAEFDHPNLVPVYETGEIGPVCFIATAFCPGQTLGEWLDRQAFPVPVRQAARLVATVAEAVQHAHDRGVLHRDLKPNNVILQATREDPDEQEPPPGSCQLRGDTFIPRVVDFGLAKLIERGGPSDTNTRQVLGTPKYMAPEQAQARQADVGPPADVYALGVILYEMLTGRAPYEGATDVEVLRQAIDGDLTQPRHVRADVPRDLEAICLKAMAREPGKRYRTAIDFADDLRRFLDGQPTLARPLNRFGRSARWLRRNDQAVALVVVTTIATVLLAVGGWYMNQARQLRTDRDTAEREQAERTRTDQQREYARAVREAFLAWRAGDTKSAADALEAARRVARTGGELPDFPLNHLARLVAAGRLTIACPAGPVTALAVSADGKRLASGHADGTLALWNRETGEPLASVKAHDREVTHVAFAFGGSRLLSVGGMDRATETGLGWTVDPAGQLAPAPDAHRVIGQHITCLAVAPDGDAVYAGTRHGQVLKVNLRDAEQNRSVELERFDPVTAVAVSEDGKELLVGTARGKVRRFAAGLDREPREERSGGEAVTALQVLPGRKYLVGSRGALFMAVTDGWAVPTRGPVDWVLPFAHGFAAPAAPGRVLLRTDRWQELATGDEGHVRAGAVTHDGRTLFTAGDDGVIRSWEFPPDLRDRAVWSAGSVTAVGVHPEGRWFSVAAPNSVVERFGAGDERPGPAGRAFVALRVAKDGRTLGVELRDGAAVLGELTGDRRTEEKARFTVPDGAAPASADLSADGTRLAVGDDRGRVFVWAVAEGVRVAAIDCGHRRAVRRVSLSSDGQVLAAATVDGVGVWTVPDGKPVSVVAAGDADVFRLLPAGDRLATAGRGGAVRVWTVASGREELTLFGHVGAVTGLGASPDGRTLVSGGATGEVKFWDVRTGAELVGLRRHSTPVTVVEFSAAGNLLVTAGAGQVAVWDARE